MSHKRGVKRWWPLWLLLLTGAHSLTVLTPPLRTEQSATETLRSAPAKPAMHSSQDTIQCPCTTRQHKAIPPCGTRDSCSCTEVSRPPEKHVRRYPLHTVKKPHTWHPLFHKITKNLGSNNFSRCVSADASAEFGRNTMDTGTAHIGAIARHVPWVPLKSPGECLVSTISDLCLFWLHVFEVSGSVTTGNGEKCVSSRVFKLISQVDWRVQDRDQVTYHWRPGESGLSTTVECARVCASRASQAESVQAKKTLFPRH